MGNVIDACGNTMVVAPNGGCGTGGPKMLDLIDRNELIEIAEQKGHMTIENVCAAPSKAIRYMQGVEWALRQMR